MPLDERTIGVVPLLSGTNPTLPGTRSRNNTENTLEIRARVDSSERTVPSFPTSLSQCSLAPRAERNPEDPGIPKLSPFSVTPPPPPRPPPFHSLSVLLFFSSRRQLSYAPGHVLITCTDDLTLACKYIHIYIHIYIYIYTYIHTYAYVYIHVKYITHIRTQRDKSFFDQ